MPRPASALPIRIAPRRSAYSPPDSSCLTFVLTMSTVIAGSRNGMCSICLRAAIEQHEMIGPAHHRCKLVHDAARHAGEFVLGFLAEQSLFDGFKRRARHRFEQRGRGDFERRAAGQARRRSARWIRSRPEIRAAACRARRSRRSRQRRSSTSGRAWHGVGGFVERDLRLHRSVGDAEHRRAVLSRQACRAAGDDHAVAVDRHRQHEAVVVVDVLADEIDAARRGGDPLRLLGRSVSEGGPQRWRLSRSSN